MTTFRDKENAEENKHARDQETEFKVHARRNKLLGAWVAGKLGLSGAEAETYAKSIAMTSDTALLHKVKADFAAAKVAVSEHDIHDQMHKLQAQAHKEIAG